MTGFEDLEPGIGEVAGDGYAEIYYGAEPSADVMVSVRAGSPAVFELIGRLAEELGMAVALPAESDWSLAVLGSAQAEHVPDASWDGWENFGEESRPTVIVCGDREELSAALRSSYGGWEAWASRSD